MIRANDYGVNLMKAISLGGTVSFPSPYLGLLAAMPGTDMSGGAEISYPEYARVQIYAKGIEGKTIMGTPYTKDTTDSDENVVKAAKVSNQERIYFPDNETGDTVYAIGWALYDSLSATKPYMCGKLTLEKDEDGNDIPLEIRKDSVPMVRIGDLVLGVQ